MVDKEVSREEAARIINRSKVERTMDAADATAAQARRAAARIEQDKREAALLADAKLEGMKLRAEQAK